MSKLLCCDWGTSTFRLDLVDYETGRVLADDKSDQGIARTFELWQGKSNRIKERESFYFDFIQSRIALLEHQLNESLHETPLVISGMASSSIGIEELPYKNLPFAINGSDLIVKKFKWGIHSHREVLLISGVRCNSDDVMRGEETLLIGSTSEGVNEKRKLFIFPGTHSKHIRVQHEKVISFQTFMTGEFFDLLTHHGILAHSVFIDNHSEKTKEAFKEGVLKGIHGNLLHSCFSVRTNDIFKRCTKGENYYFLSGLFIGNELKGLHRGGIDITLVCGEVLRPLYESALKVLQTNSNHFSFENIPADGALIRGQIKIYNALNKVV